MAAGFPTTVNPIFQNRLVPVFVDVTMPKYEIDVANLKQHAAKEQRQCSWLIHWATCLISMRSSAFTRKHNLWLIEDCCDALGSTYKGRNVGTSVTLPR